MTTLNKSKPDEVVEDVPRKDLPWRNLWQANVEVELKEDSRVLDPGRTWWSITAYPTREDAERAAKDNLLFNAHHGVGDSISWLGAYQVESD